jgi:hypothetical protein
LKTHANNGALAYLVKLAALRSGKVQDGRAIKKLLLIAIF